MAKQPKTLEDIVAEVAMVRPRYQARLDKFIARLAEDPAYAFSWGNEAVEAGVRLRTLADLEAYAQRDPTEGRTAEEHRDLIRAYFADEAHRMARQVPSSTSHMSNLVENYKRAYLAEIVDWLDGGFLCSL